jgi:hypothetical protein
MFYYPHFSRSFRTWNCAWFSVPKKVNIPWLSRFSRLHTPPVTMAFLASCGPPALEPIQLDVMSGVSLRNLTGPDRSVPIRSRFPSPPGEYNTDVSRIESRLSRTIHWAIAGEITGYRTSNEAKYGEEFKIRLNSSGFSEGWRRAQDAGMDHILSPIWKSDDGQLRHWWLCVR